MHLLQKVKINIFKNNLFNEKDRLLLAISGGVDSVVLLDVISKIHTNFVIAYFNHGIRKESLREKLFVEELSKKYNAKFVTGRARLNKSMSNLEGKARLLRYNFLFEEARKNKCTKIITAHQADDQLETVMINFTRGASFRGLSGMNFLSERDNNVIIRPFLNIFKEQIKEYQRENKLIFTEDNSNYDLRFRRNYLRQKVFSLWSLNQKTKILNKIFYLNQENESYLKGLKALYNKKIVKKSNNFVSLTWDIKNLEEENIYNLISLAVKDIRSSSSDLYSYSLGNLINNIKKGSVGVEFIIPKDIKVILDYDCILFVKKDIKFAFLKAQKISYGDNIINNIGIILKLKKASGMISFDGSKIRFPLTIRGYKSGDKIKPKGLGGTKKVKDLFIDEKIPKSLRPLYPLIVDDNNVILGALGICQSEASLITNETKNIVGLDYKKE